jgi:hypothetical protein
MSNPEMTLKYSRELSNLEYMKKGNQPNLEAIVKFD